MHVTLTTRPSRPEQPHEDLVTATDDLVVVLDGATVPGGGERRRWFTRKLGGRFLALLSSEPACP